MSASQNLLGQVGLSLNDTYKQTDQDKAEEEFIFLICPQ